MVLEAKEAGGEGMERLDHMALTPLGLVEKFHQEVKGLINDRSLPPSELINRINHVREQVRQDAEGQCDAFDRDAQELEKELLKRLEHLKEIRERAAVVRRVVGTMFRPG